MEGMMTENSTILVDGTSLNRKMKGVGRYTWQLCDALETTMPPNARLLIVDFEGEKPVFRDDFRGEFITIPYTSEFELGLRILPRLIKENAVVKLIRPSEKIGRDYGIPTLTVCHDVNPLIWNSQCKRSIARRCLDQIWEFFRGYALRRSELVMCNSLFIKAVASKWYGFKSENSVVGYCGVDRDITRAVSYEGKQKILEQMGGGYLLAFATGDEREGYDILPELWAGACAGGYPGILVIAGVKEGADYLNCLKDRLSRSHDNDRVKYLPFLGASEIALLANLYAAADYYLETSRHEGFGMQLVEAMACGTSCFSSNRGALEEVGAGYALPLDIDQPFQAGKQIAEAWTQGNHLTVKEGQVGHAQSFDWGQARDIVTKFAWNSR